MFCSLRLLLKKLMMSLGSKSKSREYSLVIKMLSERFSTLTRMKFDAGRTDGVDVKTNRSKTRMEAEILIHSFIAWSEKSSDTSLCTVYGNVH